MKQKILIDNIKSLSLLCKAFGITRNNFIDSKGVKRKGDFNFISLPANKDAIFLEEEKK